MISIYSRRLLCICGLYVNIAESIDGSVWCIWYDLIFGAMASADCGFPGKLGALAWLRSHRRLMCPVFRRVQHTLLLPSLWFTEFEENDWLVFLAVPCICKSVWSDFRTAIVASVCVDGVCSQNPKLHYILHSTRSSLFGRSSKKKDKSKVLLLLY